MSCETQTNDDFCCSPNSKVYLNTGFHTVALQCLSTAIHQHIVFTRGGFFAISSLRSLFMCAEHPQQVAGVFSVKQYTEQRYVQDPGGLYSDLTAILMIKLIFTLLCL